MSTELPDSYDVVVVGAGAAGVGVGIALQHAGIGDFVIVDRGEVGASFAAWPAETRFITPSFPTNSIGMLDLNSIAIGISPAFSLAVEHPTGPEFAAHLRSIAKFFQLPVHENVEVTRIAPVGDKFGFETSAGVFLGKHVIWAGGEFGFPNATGFSGGEHCRHTATVASYGELPGKEFIVIGGYESGIDAAYHLARNGKTVRLFDKGCPWKDESSDPSIALSTYSLERMRDERFKKNVKLFPETPIELVAESGRGYEVVTSAGDVFRTPVPPLAATGFSGGAGLVADLFESREDGFPLLNEHDESTVTPGLFLCGPAVRHDNHVFCFIYK
ncbi:MAG: NAD(P)/FAD-dependent oxidoreductase, partial [Planctomycetota bacterium]